MERRIIVYEPYSTYNILTSLFKNSFGSLFTVISYVTGWGKQDYIENYYDTTNSKEETNVCDIIDEILKKKKEELKKRNVHSKQKLHNSLYNYYNCLIGSEDEYE